MSLPSSASPQSTWQFFKKFVRWGIRDLKRHYQALPYSETRGPNYYRPLGCDDRPLRVKLGCKYFWTRGIDHVLCGLITWYYDNRVYFHSRFPKHIDPVKGPLEAYLPPLPKRFPDDFINSERERMKRLKMPPSDIYEEFTYDPVEAGDGQGLLSIGKMFGERLRKRAGDALKTVENRVPGIKDLKAGNVAELQSQATSKLGSMVGDERKQALQAALNQGQDLAKLAAKGDLKGAALNAKEIFDQKVKENQSLKDAAKDKASAFQEVVAGFIQGYSEGKQYEEIHHTDPKELLLKMQENARKAVLLAARESPGLLKSDGDLHQKLKDLAAKASDLDNIKIDPEEERKMKEMAKAWLTEKGKDVQDATTKLADDFVQSEEGKALIKKAEEAARVAAQVRERGEQMVDKAKAEAPNVRDRLQQAVETAQDRVQSLRKEDSSNKKKV